MVKPQNLGELRSSEYSEERLRGRGVRDEIRTNLIRKLESGETLFPGIVGYDDSVVPHLVSALLSRHHIILLGLRGQAKSRILRDLARFLDDEVPAIAGCEINDSPYDPICRGCRDRLAEMGDRTPIAWLNRGRRYVEKLATPDVTIADIIGDLDPIRAARASLNLSNELVIHYGLLPRAHRGIFAINELPDLAPKIQVGLFNVLQEGDVQIKGFPIRLPLDVLMAFTANPEDYTARGKIITPLKDRIGSEIRTHYAETLDHAVAITRQEAWTDRRGDGRVLIPEFLREIVDEIAIQARKDRRVDKRSGVSQRLPISVLENVVSNAERRSIAGREGHIVPRIADIYASIPAMTGKLELEYEGEMKGADYVARELVRAAIELAFSRHCGAHDFKQVVAWFDNGGYIKLPDTTACRDAILALHRIDGLIEKTSLMGIRPADDSGLRVSAAEFILEGLAATSKIGRTEERGFHATTERRPEVGKEQVAPTKRHLN